MYYLYFLATRNGCLHCLKVYSIKQWLPNIRYRTKKQSLVKLSFNAFQKDSIHIQCYSIISSQHCVDYYPCLIITIFSGASCTWCAFRTNSMAQKFLEAWSSHWTCTEMYSRNDSFLWIGLGQYSHYHTQSTTQ